MGLKISQTYAIIGIKRTQYRLDIETRGARLEFRQKHARINIHNELPRVEIDQYECFATAGLMGNLDLMKDAAQRGYQQVMSQIGKMSADGDILAAIENGGEPIADMAERDAYPVHEFELDYIPKARPVINIRGGVKFDPERNSEGTNNGVDGVYTPGHVSINFTPSRLSIYIARYNSVRFSYVCSEFDSYV